MSEYTDMLHDQIIILCRDLAECRRVLRNFREAMAIVRKELPMTSEGRYVGLFYRDAEAIDRLLEEMPKPITQRYEKETHAPHLP